MTPSFQQFRSSSTAKLAGTYLAIIMVMSLGFSVVFYNVSSRAVDRRPPGNTIVFQGVDNGRTAGNLLREFLDDRAEQARRELIARLVLINLLTLLAGAGVSYLLARRTLQPIEANMEAQRQFVSDASHELRTPLTAIQTTNEVALRNKKLTLNEAKEIIAGNTADAVKLRALSDGLLNLAQNDSAPQSLTDISLHAAVQSALNQMVSAAQSKDIAIEDTTANLKVRSNEHVLSQVLVIFLDNAIKYSPEGSTVTVSSETKGNQALVHVKDDGVGIRATDVPHVFRRFYRADNARTDSHRDGYGLGLAIADKLAASHGMTLLLTSEIDKGSVFTIKLPLVK